jgi:hypothetical protein
MQRPLESLLVQMKRDGEGDGGEGERDEVDGECLSVHVCGPLSPGTAINPRYPGCPLSLS